MNPQDTFGSLVFNDAFSCSTANIVMLPSTFFVPAMPVILDDPNSTATINCFAIRYMFLFFLQII